MLSKDEGEVFWLFGAPFTPLSDTDEPVTLTSYGRFDISMMSPGERTKVTAADYDPKRHHLLVRGWTGVLEYTLPKEQGLTELQGVSPRLVPFREEPQGEAIGYRGGNRSGN